MFKAILARLLTNSDLVQEMHRRNAAVVIVTTPDAEAFYEARNREHPQRFKYGIDGGGKVIVPDYQMQSTIPQLEEAMLRAARRAMAYGQDNDL